MGAVRKLTGQDAQMQLARENAAKQEAAAKASADAAAAQAQSVAKASADSMAQAAARQQVEAKAAEVVSTPLGTADIAAGGAPSETVTQETRRKRASFGSTYNTGVGL